jgi:hypothetical protein
MASGLALSSGAGTDWPEAHASDATQTVAQIMNLPMRTQTRRRIVRVVLMNLGFVKDCCCRLF